MTTYFSTSISCSSKAPSSASEPPSSASEPPSSAPDRTSYVRIRTLRTHAIRTLLATLLVLVAADSQARLPARRALRSSSDSILIVGNSFTSGIKNRLRHLAHSAGRDVFVGVCAGDGYTLP